MLYLLTARRNCKHYKLAFIWKLNSPILTDAGLMLDPEGAGKGQTCDLLEVRGHLSPNPGKALSRHSWGYSHLCQQNCWHKFKQPYVGLLSLWGSIRFSTVPVPLILAPPGPSLLHSTSPSQALPAPLGTFVNAAGAGCHRPSCQHSFFTECCNRLSACLQHPTPLWFITNWIVPWAGSNNECWLK